MNVWEKLNLARVQMLQKGIKQNGKNDYSGYSYFRLDDILPESNRICAELKATIVVNFEAEMAYLKFIDAEKPEDMIVFTSPMSKAALKGCHEVQNLGAVETYIKRYLYQSCFEIAESDKLDGGAPLESDMLTEDEKKLEKLLKDNEQILGKSLINSPYEKVMQVLTDGGDVQAMIKRTEDYLAKKKAKNEAK